MFPLENLKADKKMSRPEMEEKALEAAKLVNGDGKDESPAEPEDPNEARFKRIEDAIADLTAKLAPPAEDTVPEEIEEESGEEAEVD
jgi:hypothetical protein